MIHKNSSDIVLIKKIALKIWSLRDEIEARIEEQMNSGIPEEKLNLLQLHEEYTPRHLQNNNVLALKANEELDTGEDEMARAMAGMEDEEAKEAEETISELSTPTNIVSIDKNIISINLTPPNIPEDKLFFGKTLLSEINMNQMFFFCNKSFSEGQSIVIQFCIPNSFIVNADILYCRPFNLKSRIISANKYSHRTLIRFNFLKDGERALLRQFLQSIEPAKVVVAKKVDKNDSDDNGFGDLEDLGL